jgi:hypothetical protein
MATLVTSIFFNIREMGCILWKNFPCWHLDMGVTGSPDSVHPGFGLSDGVYGYRTSRYRPCPLQEFSPLRFTAKFSPRTGTRWLLGLGLLLATSAQVEAQQYYYYYPSSGVSQPSYNVQPQTGTPVYSYTPQYSQPTYTPQYYQYPATTQYYQTNQTTQNTPVVQYSQVSQAQTTGGQALVPTTYTAPAAQPAPAQPAQGAAAAPAPAGDPYGFLGWLNSVRATYGLGAVGYDANLSNWAAVNNQQQQTHGLGHFVMGPARRQNSAMGASFPGSMWMASPAHRAALLDPTISWIGIAAAGAYWTFNAY